MMSRLQPKKPASWMRVSPPCASVSGADVSHEEVSRSLDEAGSHDQIQMTKLAI